MIRLDMGEPPLAGTSNRDWAGACIRLVRVVEGAFDKRCPDRQVHATLTFNGVTVPVYADDDTSRVTLRLSAAKPKTSQTHPSTMIGRSGRG